MHKQNTYGTGFTIVELLIVIVVIAILAAISVVAYTGIQNRANDTAVQSDVSNFAKKIQLYYAEYGEYPVGGNTNAPTGIGNFPVARGSYATISGNHNFIYCTGTVSGQPAYVTGAASKSGNGYFISSAQGSLGSYSGSWTAVYTTCSNMLPGLTSSSRSYGFNGSTELWHAWTN